MVFESDNQSNINKNELPNASKNNEPKRKSERPEDPVWEWFDKGNLISKGHWQATCKFCNKSYKKGCIADIQDHLGNHCLKVTKKVGDYYCALVSLRDNSNGDSTQAESLPRRKKRRCVTSYQPLITDHIDSTNIISAHQSRINQAAIRAFTCAGISF